MRQGHSRRLGGNETETLELHGGEVVSQYNRGHRRRGRQQVSAGGTLVCTIVIVNREIPWQKESWSLGGQVGRPEVYRKETNL